jgi:hypothetical protein
MGIFEIMRLGERTRENYLYGPLKTQAYFLGSENFQLTYLASNPTFDSLSGLSVNLTL